MLSVSAQTYGTKPDSSKIGKGLDRVELEYAKLKYQEMLLTADYKKSRKLAAAIREKVGELRVPMSDSTIVVWLITNLKYTEYRSIEEAKLMICSYIEVSNRLMSRYSDVYDLIGNATYIQAVEILEPELRLTKEDLWLED